VQHNGSIESPARISLAKLVLCCQSCSVIFLGDDSGSGEVPVEVQFFVNVGRVFPAPPALGQNIISRI